LRRSFLLYIDNNPILELRTVGMNIPMVEFSITAIGYQYPTTFKLATHIPHFFLKVAYLGKISFFIDQTTNNKN
jgi:hypothetical protein